MLSMKFDWMNIIIHNTIQYNNNMLNNFTFFVEKKVE